jgi:hypothetical protein
MTDEASRTIWDVLTMMPVPALVTHPDRPSHALVTLGSGWAVSVTVSPGARCSSGLARMLSTGATPDDLMGRHGSPEGWFDLASDAEIAIKRDDGTWYACETESPWPPVRRQTWGYVDPDQLADLIERVDQQPGGCLCPSCHP